MEREETSPAEEKDEIELMSLTILERAVLLLLHKTDDTVHTSIPEVLAEDFKLNVSLSEIERVIKELSRRGLVAVRITFTALLGITTYLHMIVGLTTLGRQVVQRLAMCKNSALAIDA